MKLKISDFPLIAITEVLDMRAGDSFDGPDFSVEGILDRKRGHIEEISTYETWDRASWVQERPVYITGAGTKTATLHNGHHRATMSVDTGCLFIWYTDDYATGWSQ